MHCGTPGTKRARSVDKEMDVPVQVQKGAHARWLRRRWTRGAVDERQTRRSKEEEMDAPGGGKGVSRTRSGCKESDLLVWVPQVGRTGEWTRRQMLWSGYKEAKAPSNG